MTVHIRRRMEVIRLHPMHQDLPQLVAFIDELLEENDRLRDRLDDRASKRSRSIDRLAEELKSHPGEWRLVETRVWGNNVEKYKRRGLKTRMLRTGDFDPAVPKYDIYARWSEERDDGRKARNRGKRPV